MRPGGRIQTADKAARAGSYDRGHSALHGLKQKRLNMEPILSGTRMERVSPDMSKNTSGKARLLADEQTTQERLRNLNFSRLIAAESPSSTSEASHSREFVGYEPRKSELSITLRASPKPAAFAIEATKEQQIDSPRLY